MMTRYVRADGVLVYEDEGKWRLSVVDADGGRVVYDIHACSLDLAASLRRSGLLEYAFEDAEARATRPAADDRDAYGPDDPKHPDFHSLHADRDR